MNFLWCGREKGSKLGRCFEFVPVRPHMRSNAKPSLGKQDNQKFLKAPDDFVVAYLGLLFEEDFSAQGNWYTSFRPFSLPMMIVIRALKMNIFVIVILSNQQNDRFVVLRF
jgi:hypothetical protein